MKKLLALILAAALALSLVACGGDSGAEDTNTPNSGNTTPTKEEMLESAETITITDIYKSVESNKVNANETYIGNIYIISGTVHKIENDYIELYESNISYNATVKVYMSTNDIKELETNSSIEIVGEISVIDFLQEKEDEGMGIYTLYTSGVELSPAYLVK